jgi:acetyltransferase-like isoleucine patch superfamily enzyme
MAVIKKMIELLAVILSALLPYALLQHGQRFVSKVKWYSLRKCFGSVGAGSSIEMPALITNPRNMFIGQNFSALTYLRMETFEEYLQQKFTPKLLIGDNVSFNNDCHIGCINRIEIGNNVLGASRIYITDHYHGEILPHDLQVIPTLRPLSSKGPVIIKDNVWIGEGVAILPGVTIGKNAIIGANSVVNRDIPDNAVAAGIPAKVIRILA